MTTELRFPRRIPERAVFKVLVPIPEIGAQPGDLLHAEPAHPEYPLSLTRHLDRSNLPIVLDDQRVTQIWVVTENDEVSSGH